MSEKECWTRTECDKKFLPVSRCQTVSTCEHKECSVQGRTCQQLQHTARSCSLTQTKAQHTHTHTHTPQHHQYHNSLDEC